MGEMFHVQGPRGPGTQEQGVGGPVRDEDLLGPDGSVAVHVPQDGEHLLQDLLGGHTADGVVELPPDGAEEDVGSPGEISTPGLHVLPGLEPAKIFQHSEALDQ